ncbi:MAG TPA: hypothetical protein DEG17_02465 [Cyanobacteria bacterium UBA11149]|nr:hypothetical protein [Cyanobacteria bacterium UBA11367]HBE61016.1 hypothetical protein [Cyanobacteria bacterium UBA11366]HBK63816.1 hypothetical protein [Cyanobacteria bacterium UBA11166]HBR74288.1 hypothetical protein [Cyanobacteria bacterium UBA11159]HBS71075.1 hypothetical protein [Cyanobacteria bacterium UBA11153]HBW87770.1 hypothetical protein [Cyanobacteria bacterium UBA11149]HCA93214.1 hypothetical protein [Cyanobacteria bacterium UBA9226]
MNIKRLALAITCTAILAVAIPVMAQMSIQMDENSIRVEGRRSSVESGKDGIIIESDTPFPNGNPNYQNSIQRTSQPNSNQRTIRRDVDSARIQENIRANNLTDSAQSPQELQQSTISLNLSDLKQPQILQITTPRSTTELSGQIKIDGKAIQTLSNKGTEINLSPYLTRGRHIVEISGNYSPSSSSVKVEFTGTNTQNTQQTEGSGEINQILIINVRDSQ